MPSSDSHINSSITRMAKSVIERHIKMIKEYDNDKISVQSNSSTSTNSNSKLSKYYEFLKSETEKINQELLNSKEVKSKMEIKKIAIERWKLLK